MTHIFISKLILIVSDNGLSPGRHQAIIWTNAGILLIESLGIKFREISIEIHTFSITKMHLEISSVKWRPFCLGLNAFRVVLWLGWLMVRRQVITWTNNVLRVHVLLRTRVFYVYIHLYHILCKKMTNERGQEVHQTVPGRAAPSIVTPTISGGALQESLSIDVITNLPQS